MAIFMKISNNDFFKNFLLPGYICCRSFCECVLTGTRYLLIVQSYFLLLSVSREGEGVIASVKRVA